VTGHVSVHLARFAEPSDIASRQAAAPDGATVWKVGGDQRRASDTTREVANEFVAIGVHPTRDSADACAAAALAAFDGAIEQWSGVLRPVRSIGHLNWAGTDDHRLPCVPGPRVDGPMVVMTSVGWDLGEGFRVEDAIEFGDRVELVRRTMGFPSLDTPVPGLRSQQSFGFPGIIVDDPITLTFWDDEAAMRAFAYDAGPHRTEMDRFRAEPIADRTSFTRFAPVASDGTWRGRDPLG
jgi:hypothetical protein